MVARKKRENQQFFCQILLQYIFSVSLQNPNQTQKISSKLHVSSIRGYGLLHGAREALVYEYS